MRSDGKPQARRRNRIPYEAQREQIHAAEQGEIMGRVIFDGVSGAPDAVSGPEMIPADSLVPNDA